MKLLLSGEPLPLEAPDRLLLRPHLAAVHLVPQAPLVLPEPLLAPPHVSQPLQLVLLLLSELFLVLLAEDGFTPPDRRSQPLGCT